ncbi:2-hydroxychromene-2-carboxylate isomerase [Magnetovibrio sp. PR-2]|uniref:2-hydroxychromene-2-carboxylate isomerase n=1 Tax=Magnetovibrio sp. PR-2 TaxID=3120356 RepID=UPI002FCE4A30
MNTPHIDYYFSVVSPWTYFGDARLHDIAQATGATLGYHPCSSPELFPNTGGKMLKDRGPNRQNYRMVELKRWKTHLNLDLNPTPAHFPVPEAPGSKLVLAAKDAGHDPGPLVSALLKAVWVEDKDVSDPETLTTITNTAGLNGEVLLAASQDAKYDEAFTKSTQDAIDAGVFGYPTYVTDGVMFWGQDRLDFLERKLKG